MQFPSRAICAIAALVSLGGAGQAAMIVVDSTADDVMPNGNCTLREAVLAANADAAVDTCTAGSGADVIVLPADVYSLSRSGSSEDGAASGDKLIWKWLKGPPTSPEEW